jgi:tryptophan synthase alpha chain
MGMLSEKLKSLVANNKKALVAYIVAGDPEPGVTVPLMHRLVESGVDVIELGVPFSDPEAEGPVIQLAHERALAHNISLADCLEMAAEFRQCDKLTPIVLMGYLNPVEAMGYEKFSTKAARSGVNGTIIVNLPPEEAVDMSAFLEVKDIEPVYLLAPTTTDERALMICKASKGFVYYVSRKGTTGAGNLDIDDVSEKMTRFRKFSELPIIVGFGVKDSSGARAVSQLADGAVVGSAIVKLMDENRGDLKKLNHEVGQFVSELRAAID